MMSVRRPARTYPTRPSQPRQRQRRSRFRLAARHRLRIFRAPGMSRARRAASHQHKDAIAAPAATHFPQDLRHISSLALRSPWKQASNDCQTGHAPCSSGAGRQTNHIDHKRSCIRVPREQAHCCDRCIKKCTRAREQHCVSAPPAARLRSVFGQPERRPSRGRSVLSRPEIHPRRR